MPTLTEDRRGRPLGSIQEDPLPCVHPEAAGEGIDPQESCSALIHGDLPWNPMCLRQRVARLSQYGQGDQVDVVMVKKPDTIESRIWECLDQKLERITLAFRGRWMIQRTCVSS
jgi:hypothetical protein